jgi:hypothetical protein
MKPPENRDQCEPSKKPYSAPVLQVYGTFPALTAGVNTKDHPQDNPGNQKSN